MRYVFAFSIVLSLVTSVHGSERGVASVYSGEKTSTGRFAREWSLTAAHWTLPFGTLVKVTNLKNKRAIIVEIDDRGPAPWTHRLIDLTPAAAELIGIDGLGEVEINVVGKDK
jgi:peptidoglycan lytic transglycosylase